MLHLSEFSGPDTLLVKSADDGCCSEPSTELPRLPVRDAAAGYPGGKKRGCGCSDGGAVRGRTVPERGRDWDAGGVGVAVVGSSGVLGCAPPLPPHRAVSASAGNCACIKVSFLPVHVCFGCACFLRASWSVWLLQMGSNVQKGTLCVSVGTQGSLGRGRGPRRALSCAWS